MTGPVACTSKSLDARTEVIAVLPERGGRASDLAACISAAMASGKTAVVVDLSALERLDSGVLAALIHGQSRLGWRNGRLAVVGPAGERGMGESILLDAAFDVCDSVRDALIRVRGRWRTDEGVPA